MFKFRFPHKPNAKTKLARRVFFVRKRTLAIPAGLAAVCALCLITTLPSYVSAASTQRQLPIYCVQREDKVCSLTFDAAWGNEDTQQLIDILGRYHVKATFFVVGDWVEKYPESVKALSDAGHEVMSHSDTHAHFNALSAQEIVADLTTAGEKIAAITGKTPSLFRPPFGEYDDHVIATVRGMGIEPIQWDVEGLAAVGAKTTPPWSPAAAGRNQGVLSFSVWFSFDQAPLLVKRNAVVKFLVVVVPERFRIPPVIDLFQCRLTRRWQSIQAFHAFDLEDRESRVILVKDDNIAAPFAVLAVRFHTMPSPGKNTGQERMVKVFLVIVVADGPEQQLADLFRQRLRVSRPNGLEHFLTVPCLGAVIEPLLNGRFKQLLDLGIGDHQSQVTSRRLLR